MREDEQACRETGTSTTTIPLPKLEALNPSNGAPNVQWLPSSDGTEIACRRWLGAANKPAIVYLHGIEGHSLWFEHTAAVLNSQGFTIYAPDRRGAGLNRSARGHLAKHKLYLADIELLLQQMHNAHPQSPIFLFGNCWGAKAAAVLASNGYKSVRGEPLPEIAGLILTCPALFTRVDLTVKEKALIGRDIIFGGSDKRHIAIPIEVEMFTDNPEFLEFLESDPLRLKSATTRFYFENFVLSLKAAAAAKRIQLPVLLAQTDKDRIVDFDRVQRWFQRVGSNDKIMHIFPGGSHSIDFDTRWFREYITLLTNWMNDKAVSA